MLEKKIDDILSKVTKPTRYMGNEYNMVVKEARQVDIRFAFAFPDVYEVGMSHLGLKILYHLLNERSDTYCERVFAPWLDMEEHMRKHDIPLFSLETKSSILDFDFLGFTLQYEMSYTNVLNMMDLAGIPLLGKDRNNRHPFVIAGGPCAFNPEPLAQFIDFFVLGEGEEVIHEILDMYKEWKKVGGDRESFLIKAASIPGVYVPAFYHVSYHDDGTVKKVEARRKEVPDKIVKRIVKDIERVYFPDKIIVPFMDIIHDRIMLEVFRGCTRGCRFCQAGMIYRPVREKSVEKLVELAEKLVKNTGYEEISLSSLSTGDYAELETLVKELISRLKDKRVSVSLPSLRIDSFAKEFIEEVQKVRKTGLTFAPEAGTQRLRDVINKGVTEDDLISSVEDAFSSGWTSVKLYFMIGLPTEEKEDLDGIAELTKKVREAYYRSVPKEARQKGLRVTVSTSSFVPKPFTPFQWVSQASMDELREKQAYLKNLLKLKNVSYNWHTPELSFIEAVFSRGDRKLGNVLLKAWEKGCKFDGWIEQFRFDEWMKSFEACKIDPSFYALRERKRDEIFPWDHIDVGVTKRFLLREYEKALRGEVTLDCRSGCVGCGITSLGKGACG
ncbi:MAG: TIGR03960 family B12-binding radical SAM protein [Clostridia bacterium]